MDRVGGYELEALIGAGLSGTVWRARRPGPLPVTVALKRAGRPESRQDVAMLARLRAEAIVLADLDHPHIVAVLDVIDDGDGVAIAMPLARGGSLRSLLDERQTLAAGQVVAVVAPVADALASAHRRGLVHGDVKPENVLFTSDGEPLLSDFGAARHLATPVVAGSDVMGTAPYLDPELLDGAAPSPLNDLYSLAVVCYEALTGAPPHGGSTEEVLLAADRSDHLRLSDMSSIPGPLADLVERALSRQARDRPPGMQEFAAALRASVDPASVELPGPASIGPGDCPVRAGDRRIREAGRHGTRLFGPRPPRPTVTGRPADRRGIVGVVALGTVALALAGAVWLRHGHHAASKSREGVVPTTRVASCRTYPRLDPPAGAQRFRVDLNGDGCPLPVAWDGQVLSVRFDPSERTPRYYELGVAGDELLFGDWDCDGAETPALYRATAGEVMYVNSFAAHVGDTAYAERITRVRRDGRARVVRGTHGCDIVRINPTRR